MSLFSFAWLEIAIVVALLGALCVSRLRNPLHAARAGLTFTGAVLLCTLVAWFGYAIPTAGVGAAWSVQRYLPGNPILELDELSATLIVGVALLHFLTVVATARTKARCFSLSWSLTTEALRLALFTCTDLGVLVLLLILETLLAYAELRNRGRPIRVYLAHMAVYLGLLLLGWLGLLSANGAAPPTWTTVVLLAAVLFRCGVAPAHCWLTDWFEHASFGIGLLFVVPLTGAYAAIRLVLPLAPDWALQAGVILSLVTAVYATGMSLIQRDIRRFFAYLFLGNSSLVLVGLQLSTATSLTGSLALWFSVLISLGGFGLVLRALEGRFGRLSLAGHHGLYEHSPTLAACFLVTGLASVGFPGTLGFVATDLLVDGAIAENLGVGLAVIAAAALGGIAIVRVYLLLFTGARPHSTVDQNIRVRERIAVLTLLVLIVGGGLFPQPGVSMYQHIAEGILEDREASMKPPAVTEKPAQTTPFSQSLAVSR
jgi:NADH-quinone oxidoreductase subunit M